jgi:hypothetical protein
VETGFPKKIMLYQKDRAPQSIQSEVIALQCMSRKVDSGFPMRKIKKSRAQADSF